MTPVRFDAVVLAGGGGTRLGGVDKAAVELAGRPLVARSFDAAAGADRVVLVGATQAPLPRHVLVTREDPPGSGPAAALVAGLALLPQAQWVLVLACDLPGAPTVVPTLLQHADRDGAVAVDGDGRRQWLFGIYPADALRDAASRLGDPHHRSLRALLGDLDLVEVPVAPDDLHDVDTWTDHDCWTRRTRQS